MKRFTMTVTMDDDGYVSISTENGGFTGGEIVGLLEMKKLDLLAQMNPNANFKRFLLNRDGSKTEIVEEEA